MKLLFVNMPFSPPGPAMGLSLLKAHARRLGHDAHVIYLSVRFEDLVGPELYRYVEAENGLALLGDWVFAHCLSDHAVRRPPAEVPADSRLVDGLLDFLRAVGTVPG